MFLTVVSTMANKEDAIFLTELYERYYPVMKKKAYEISHDYMVAEDLIQDAFIRLIDKVETLRSLEPGRQISYLVHTMRNISLNYVKQRKRQTDKLLLGQDNDVEWIADDQPSLEEMYSLKEEYHEIGRIIGKLSERDRYLLYSKYILELADKELAASLGIHTANVRSYLTRARRRAMKLLLQKEAEVADEKTCG